MIKKEFTSWFEAVAYAQRHYLWGKIEIVLSNKKYIIVEKEKGKEDEQKR